MTDTTQNTRVLLASRPHGEPTSDNFRIESVSIPQPAEGEVLLRTIYLSLDPYMRGRMSAAKSYVAPVELGAVMEGGTVAEVVESRDDSLRPGDFVLSHVGWQSYGVAAAKHVRKLDPARAPISTALGILGMTGFTAYAGLLEIGKPQPGETVVVAAAAGPVGSAVGQIARIKGARAVGIAGGPDKVAWLEELGFDVALDHRSPTFVDDLKAAVPDGIDVYFENVGGHVWDAVLPHLNTYARVPVCGLVAHYNETELPPGPDRSSRLMTHDPDQEPDGPGVHPDRVREVPRARVPGGRRRLAARRHAAPSRGHRRGARERSRGVRRPAHGQELRQAARAGRRRPDPHELAGYCRVTRGSPAEVRPVPVRTQAPLLGVPPLYA